MNKSYIVDSSYEDIRIDKWIRNFLGKAPQGLIEKLLRIGKIKLNNKKIKSSTKLHLKDVIDYYKKNYTPKNTIFLVSGKINTQHVLNIFKKKLPKPKKNDKINIFDNCFTFKNTNIFLKNVKSKTSTCIICFPTNVKYYDKKSYILKLAIMCLRYILFVHLRYDKSLIYSIKTDINKNSCGTLITFKYYTPSFNTNKTFVCNLFVFLSMF